MEPPGSAPRGPRGGPRPRGRCGPRWRWCDRTARGRPRAPTDPPRCPRSARPPLPARGGPRSARSSVAAAPARSCGRRCGRRCPPGVAGGSPGWGDRPAGPPGRWPGARWCRGRHGRRRGTRGRRGRRGWRRGGRARWRHRRSDRGHRHHRDGRRRALPGVEGGGVRQGEQPVGPGARRPRRAEIPAEVDSPGRSPGLAGALEQRRQVHRRQGGLTPRRAERSRSTAAPATRIHGCDPSPRSSGLEAIADRIGGGPVLARPRLGPLLDQRVDLGGGQSELG